MLAKLWKLTKDSGIWWHLFKKKSAEPGKNCELCGILTCPIFIPFSLALMVAFKNNSLQT